MRTTSDSQTGTTLRALLLEPNDPMRWHAFVDRYGPLVYGWCRKWRAQEADADDVTQDVLHVFYQCRNTFAYDPKKGSFRGWLKAVAEHALHDLWSKRQRGGAGSGDSQVQDWLASVEAREDLAAALEREFDLELAEEAKARVTLRVDTRTWEVFRLLVEEERPGVEVAAQFGTTVAAVYMAKSRIIKMLRQEIAGLEKNQTH